MELKIELDRKSLAKFRRLMAASPKVAAQALTFTAEKAVPEWRAGQSIFHKRDGWIDRGIRVKWATPGNLEAQVGSVDKFMGRHVLGFGQRKVAGPGRLFVPIQPASAQGTHTQIRRMLKRAAETKRKPFRVRDLILRRRSKDRDDLVVLGALRGSVKIEPRLDALTIVDRVVQREFPTLYERLLLKWSERA